ncbi:IS1182 family transposase [Deinococcus marmoris]|uniref:IS1182 family transposase n=1 Tax=Deinococcus marmoris TaxID=249408 RepID=UPI00049848E7|nr:IS1182 family transposase [Deinococcus marmoris]
MSLHPQPWGDVPEETARVARASFPKGNTIMRLRDEFGALYQDEDFAALFPRHGQPAWSPWRLALITVYQFLEQLSDRSAADAVRGRLDWKYALSLELDDSGFDHTVLSEFRTRLVNGNAELLLLDQMLSRFRESGLLKSRGKQRTDSTHVLTSVRVLTRHEHLAETFRAALNTLATVDPFWLKPWVPEAWFERYGRRMEEFRLPKSKANRTVYLQQLGQDGFRLLDALEQDEDLVQLRSLPAIHLLHAAWHHHFARQPDGVRLRDPEELGPHSERFNSPYDPEARFAQKKNRRWYGYKVHLTEACDDDLPHLITHVHTVPAFQADIDAMTPVHTALSRKQVTPAEHFVDSAYVSTASLVNGANPEGIEVVGPIRADAHWQSREPDAFSLQAFQIDWEARAVTCPQGHVSRKWLVRERPKRTVISVRFARRDCLHCPVRQRCTRNVSGHARELTLMPQELFEARNAQRATQHGQPWLTRYRCRAGIEGTISQGVRAYGLRQARYRGERKTQLQAGCLATAINVERLVAWLTGRPRETTRISRFAALVG